MEKRISIVLFALIAVSVFMSGLGITRGSTVGVTWVKCSENPLDMGLDRAANPWVIYDGHLFRMWYEGGSTASIYYATSNDGVNWNPHGMVLDKGVAGSWEELQVTNPVVLFDGSVYRMWYLGYSHSPFPAHRIGFASSTDGIVWQKHESNPILVPGGNGGWDDGGLALCTVIFDEGLYKMWYNGQAYMHSMLKIGLATSLDGISWTKYAGNPVLAPGSGWDSKHIYTGPVIKKAGAYSMWYSGQDSSDKVTIGLATSPNGTVWSKYNLNPVLDVGPSGSWDSAWIVAGSVVEENGVLFLWYYGSPSLSGPPEKIGLASSGELEAKVDIDPDTLNLRSKGKWITAYVELPVGYDVAEVTISTIWLNGSIGVEPSPFRLGDYDSDGIADLMVEFDRAAVQGLILSEGIISGSVVLTVSGKLNDGTPFEGSDTIKVVAPKHVPIPT